MDRRGGRTGQQYQKEERIWTQKSRRKYSRRLYIYIIHISCTIPTLPTDAYIHRCIHTHTDSILGGYFHRCHQNNQQHSQSTQHDFWTLNYVVVGVGVEQWGFQVYDYGYVCASIVIYNIYSRNIRLHCHSRGNTYSEYCAGAPKKWARGRGVRKAE